jgi:cation:H+ antiporter
MEDGPVDLLVATLLVVAGAALLTFGAERFTAHVGTASARLGVSVLALAILLAGAEPEEAVTAMLASGQAHPALAAGDAIGANLVILTLSLGLASLLTPLPVTRRVMEYAVGAGVAGVVAVVLLWNGVLGRVEGALLVAVYVAAVTWVWGREQQPPVVGESRETTIGSSMRGGDAVADAEVSRALTWLLIGVLAMVVGGYLAVRGAEGLVAGLGVEESVIGLTVLGLATSAEMVALVWAARRHGLTEVVVAATVGAVTYNATMSLGLAALVNPLGLGRHNPIIAVACVTALLPPVLLLGRRSATVPRPVGAALLLGYVATTGWLLMS